MNLHPETSPEADRLKHSTYYHSYFEGYTEARVPADNKAGYRLERTYTADYLSMQDTHPVLRKIKYLVLFLACTVSFLLAAIPASEVNKTWYVALPVALSFFCLFLTGVFLLFYISWPRKMTLYQFSYSNKLQLSSLCSGVCSCIAAASTLLSIILAAVNGSSAQNLTGAVLSLLGYLTCGILFLILYFLENKNTYIRIKNDEEGPLEGNYIC